MRPIFLSPYRRIWTVGSASNGRRSTNEDSWTAISKDYLDRTIAMCYGFGLSWRFSERSISLGRAPQESDVSSSQSSSDDRTSMTNRDSQSWPTIAVRSGHDRPRIAARWPHDRDQSTLRLRPRSFPIEGPRSHDDHGHQSMPTTGSNGRNSRANFPFKKPCISPLFFNF